MEIIDFIKNSFGLCLQREGAYEKIKESKLSVGFLSYLIVFVVFSFLKFLILERNLDEFKVFFVRDFIFYFLFLFIYFGSLHFLFFLFRGKERFNETLKFALSFLTMILLLEFFISDIFNFNILNPSLTLIVFLYNFLGFDYSSFRIIFNILKIPLYLFLIYLQVIAFSNLYKLNKFKVFFISILNILILFFLVYLMSTNIIALYMIEFIFDSIGLGFIF